MDDPLSRIRNVSVFGALKDDTLRFLLSRAAEIRARPGELLVRERDAGGDLYILDSGRVEVYKERGGDKRIRVRLAELDGGDCFGETSMLACTPRTASVRALTDCVVLRLRSTDLVDLWHRDVEQFAILMMNLGREAARRLGLANELLLDRLLAEG